MSFFEVFKSELKKIFSDVAIVLTIIGGVVLYSFLYPQPYSQQSVSSLDVSVVDNDRTKLSRDIIYNLDATAQIDIKRVDLSQKDALDALVRGDVKAVIVIPDDFQKNVILGNSPTIALGADSSYFLIYGGVLEGAMKSVLTTGAVIKVANLLKEQVPMKKAKDAYSSFSLNIINLFNPQNSYIEYVVPAVFVLILQQTLLIGLGILGGSVNEQMQRGERGYFSDASIFYMMLSRYVIFGVIFFVHMLFYFGFSFEMFGVSHLASIKDLLTFGVVFLFAVISFGIFLGSVFSYREIATPVVLFSSLPLVFSAGFVWPKEHLNTFIIFLANLIPSTPAIDGFLKLNQMGADFGMVLDDFSLLFVHGLFYAFLGYYFINKKRKKYVKV